MKISIRVDSSAIIGNGHIYRCLSLALALRNRGASVIFFCRKDEGSLDKLIMQNGFKLISYPCIDKSTVTPSHHTWLGEEMQSDAFLTMRNLRNHEVDLLIVDHYAINDAWISQVRAGVKKILLIDDLYRNLDVDFVLNPNLGASLSSYDCNSRSQYLIGPKYALLRDEFVLNREKSLMRRELVDLRKVVVSMGGTDPFNATAQVIDVLDIIHYQIDVDVILAMNAPHIEDLIVKINNSNRNIRLIIQPENFVDILTSADLAIGSAGTSMLERCCLGVPSLIYVAADNQREFARKYSDIGAAFLFEDFNQLSNFFIKFNEKKRMESELRKMSNKARFISDGLGVSRVMDLLLPLGC